MTGEPPREVRTWSVADDGSKTPLSGTGLRVPLPSGCWVAIDFHHQGPRGPIVDVAVRAVDLGRRPLPSLAIVPCAGNYAWVVIGRGSPGDDGSLGVVVVDAAELGDDIDGWRRRTTSGDPLGEIVLVRPDVQPVSARRFVLDYGAIASVQLSVRASTEALLVVEVLDCLQQVPPPASEFPSLDMSVRFGGSNAVSFWFEEVIGEIIEEPDA